MKSELSRAEACVACGPGSPPCSAEHPSPHPLHIRPASAPHPLRNPLRIRSASDPHPTRIRSASDPHPLRIQLCIRSASVPHPLRSRSALSSAAFTALASQRRRFHSTNTFSVTGVAAAILERACQGATARQRTPSARHQHPVSTPSANRQHAVSNPSARRQQPVSTPPHTLKGGHRQRSAAPEPHDTSPHSIFATLHTNNKNSSNHSITTL